MLYSIFVVWGVMTVVFFLVRVIPGNPAAMMLGPDATPEMIETVTQNLGLDKPLIDQYGIFFVDILQGDLGNSLYLNRSSVELVIERIPSTVTLAIYSVIISTVIALPLGMLAAIKPNSIFDRVVSLITLFAQSLPDFWVGFMLILIFSRYLRLLPTSGTGTWQHMVMPLITLSFPLTTFMTRLVRAGMLDVMGKDYIRTARAKGAREQRVISRHVFKNMLIPLITLVGLQLGVLMGGVVITETVFAWPGVGRLLVDSILRKDFPVVQAAVLFIALSYVFVNLLVDIAYAYIDPRIRYA